MSTKRMRYRCVDCGNEEVVHSSDPRIDGRSCVKCRGHSTAVGYDEVDFAKGDPVGLKDFRCSNCNKLLGKIDGRAEIVCTRCKVLNAFGVSNDTPEIKAQFEEFCKRNNVHSKGTDNLTLTPWFTKHLNSFLAKTQEEATINWDKAIPNIEKALGYPLYERQKHYLRTGEYTKTGRMTGRTTAYCIRLALTHNRPIKDIGELRDEEYGGVYVRYFERFFLDIWERLKDAGLPVVEMVRKRGNNNHTHIIDELHDYRTREQAITALANMDGKMIHDMLKGESRDDHKCEK